MTTLAELVFSFRIGPADTSDLDDSLSKAEKKAKAAAEKTAKSIDDAFSKAASFATQASAAISLVGAGLLGLAAKAASAGAAIDDVAKRAGVGVIEHQRLAFALEQSGGSAEGLSASYKFLDKAIVDARTGAGPAAAAFSKLGVSVEKLSATKNVEERFKIIAEGFGRIDDQALKTDLSLQVLGRGGLELLPLFAEGADGISKLGDEAARLGILMSEDAVKASAEFDDQLQKTKMQLEATTNAIGLKLMPIMQKFLENLDKTKIAITALGVYVASAQFAALPGKIGLAADGMASLAMRTAGAVTQALALGVALGTALDTAFGLSDALAGVGTIKSSGRGSVAAAELTDEERKRSMALTAEVQDLYLADHLTPQNRKRLNEANAELAYIQSHARSRVEKRARESKAAADRGFAAVAQTNKLAVDAGKVFQGQEAAVDLDDKIRRGLLMGRDIFRNAVSGFTEPSPKPKKPKKKGGGGGKQPKVDISKFEDLAGSSIRATAERVGASDIAVKAAIEAGAKELNAGKSEGVARNAALSSLGSAVGRDLTTRTTDPLLSSIFGENVPDIELSALSRGADPQVLISTINNTFSFDNEFNIDGAGDPQELGNAIALQLRDVFEGAIEASTKTAKVNFAR